MTTVTSIRVQNVRTHSDYTLGVSSGVSVVAGPNGSGKTSLIEALFIALQGTSFKGVDNDVLARESPWYRIDVAFANDATRTVKFDPARATGKKQFVIDGKMQYRLLPKYKHPVVLFEPDDLRLLGGSPSRRRQFIDRFITQLDPRYGVSLRRYERALKQRNALLKAGNVQSDALFAWDVSLSEYGAYIITQRQTFLHRLNETLNAMYTVIADTDDTVTIGYSREYGEGLQQRLLDELHVSAQRDMLLGYTSVGPHRHDVTFGFNGSPALSVASRGEVRSIVLALKFLEIDIIEAVTGKTPIVLLDDVFSELDATRQNQLVARSVKNQMIITTATGGHGIDARHVTNL